MNHPAESNETTNGRTTDGSGGDIIAFLKSQHDQVKAGFDRVLGARGAEREDAFYELRRMIAVHETAEEEVVHPVAKRALPEGKAIVAARLREENEAKKALGEIGKLPIESAEFETRVRELQTAVVAHDESEEREELTGLEMELEDDTLQRMRKVAEFAESVAPTRPHPGVESAAANILSGPFASVVDRARDAMMRKH
jgi:hemerythrin superfamily protein